MSGPGALSVVAHGMITAAGLDGASTCAALRAGVSGIREANLWDSTIGAYMNAGRPVMHQWWEGASMLPVLAAPAVLQCLRAAAGGVAGTRAVDPARVPVIALVPPPSRPFRSPDLERLLVEGLVERLGHALPAGSSVIAKGRTGMLRALEVAGALIAEGRAPCCVIVGVESLLRQVIVEHYVDAGRMLCGINSNGFIPGEAACAVLVGLTRDARGPHLVIAGTGAGTEASGAGGDAEKPVTGGGLTTAMKEALAEAEAQYYEVRVLLSDSNGEKFKFKEAAIAGARLDRMPPEGVARRPLGRMEYWQPIDCLGEIGSAIFPCLLGWTLESGRKGYAPGTTAILHAGEDEGERAAVVTRYEPGERAS